MNEKIEQLRNNPTDANARYLKDYALTNGGPSFDGCFCKQANIMRFYEIFYQWWDSLSQQ